MRRIVLVSLVGVVACGPALETADLEPGEELSGGATTNTFLSGPNAFAMPAANVSEDHQPLFYSGNSFFNQAWVEAPSSTEARDGLGPLFNARSCAACHFKDGRGRPPESDDEAFIGLLLRVGEADSYGDQLQPFGISGVPGEAWPRVSYAEQPGRFDDGAEFQLRAPTYFLADAGYGDVPLGFTLSPRVAPVMVGMGLLEAIPRERLEALADAADSNGDGISGVVSVLKTGAVGRFGWKAEQPTVRRQASAAFNGDLGITTSEFPNESCTPSQVECLRAPSGGSPELAGHLLERVVLYSELLAVPQRRAWTSTKVRRGKWLFRESGCVACHTPSHETGVNAALPEVSSQRIWPYTDLLLHDMGPALADGRSTGNATGTEWRTPPLWGLGLIKDVNGHQLLMHDGRARGVAEAVMWHGGEAERAAAAFRALPTVDREALISFVESL